MAIDLHQPAFEQTLDHSPNVDPAHVLNVCARRGLLVRHDRKRFEGSPRKTKRSLLLKLLQVAGKFGAGAHLVATCDFPDFESALGLQILLVEFRNEFCH